MAFYSQFTYSNELYGTTERGTLAWAIEISAADGSFDGSNEASRCVDMVVRRGRPHVLKYNGVGFEKFRVGRCSIILEYDSNNEPEPGLYLRIRSHYSGTYYPVFYGQITDVENIFWPGYERMVRVTAEDGLRLLNDRRISATPLTDQWLSDIVPIILNKVDWPTFWGTSLDVDNYDFPYWWAEDERAADALHDLTNNEFGAIFVAADGSLTFKNSNPVGSPVESFDESELGKDLSILDPWELRRNYYKVYYYPVVDRTATELWRHNDSSLQIPAGGTKYVWANFTYDGREVPGLNLITPVSTTDYTANTAQDGSGTNKTSFMTVTIDGRFGRSAKLKIENSDSVAFYVTLLKLRGDCYDQPNKSYVEIDKTSESGWSTRLDFGVDWPLITNHADADRIASFWSALFVNEGQYPLITIDSLPTKQFVDVWDHIRVKASTIGIEQYDLKLGYIGVDYRVGLLEHRWGDSNGQRVLTTIQTEPYFDLVG